MQLKSGPEIKKWFFSLPNKLTLARIAAIPLITLVYAFDYMPTRVFCALLFLAAALTDLFDGFFARKYGIETREGALLDPIADKMLIVTGLVLVVSSNNLYAFIAILLICRDIAVSGIRMIAQEQGFNVEVNQIGKFKTASQVAAIFCLMIGQELFRIPFRTVGMLIIWVALLASIYSGYTYFKDFWDKLKSRSRPLSNQQSSL